MAELVPLFPLAHVLMPGCPLPLRLFEPRYLQLLADVTMPDGRRGFGVVALTSGSEVVGKPDDPAPQFAQVGTIAEILETEERADGTMDLLTGGSVRFRILRLVETGTPYLTAEVEFLPELDGELPENLPTAVRALATEYTRLLGALTGTDANPRDPYPPDACLLSHRIASQAPLGTDEKQSLLEAASATERLLRLQRVLRREVVLLRRTRTVAVSPGLLGVRLRPD